MQIGMEILSWGTELCAMQATQQPLKPLFQKLLVRELTTHFSISIGISKSSIAMRLLFKISAEQDHAQKVMGLVNSMLWNLWGFFEL